ncbi:galactosylceramide sulfotransferase [Anabrus simplex]|uniref:galactosylceramide sulfotransferase n=1 Tax=Anabrus simplex TaxID=316456 RepID=UPI0035A28F15
MVWLKVKVCLVLALFLTFNTLVYIVCNKHVPEERFGDYDEEKRETCIARESIVFRKTHQCAGEAVQNILLRYGLNHHLDFLLPNRENYLGMPELAFSQQISHNLQNTTGLYHILAHYTRLDTDTIRPVMRYDAAFITILRDPVSLYKTLYDYYDLEKEYNQTLSEYIKRPTAELYGQGRFASVVGFNQMSWDLGLDPKYFDSDSDIYNFIRDTEAEFDLVLFAEYLEASLVLLSITMCWPLEEVASIPFNIHYFSKEITLQKPEINRISLLNKADSALYSFFLRRFKALIRDVGEALVMDKVSQLIDINLNLYMRCIMKVTVPRKGERKYAHIKYVLNPGAENDIFCKYATMEESEFTDKVRHIQTIRWKTLHKLQKLLA